MTMKGRLLPMLGSATLQFERSRQWLAGRQQAAFFAAGIGIAVLLLIFSGVTAAVAAVAAWIALMRHFAQTGADRQRRLTETFSKATEQLGSDKIAVRIGGIYTLERISQESPNDYWTVMETLCAFLREEARWKEPDASTSVQRQPAHPMDARQTNEPLPTDIAAVLTVIVRRRESERVREQREGWRFNLVGADLRGASLLEAYLERARLRIVHLEGALLQRAHLERADLEGAHLEDADLAAADLSGANLKNAHLEGAYLENANLWGAHLEGANLQGAHLEGTDLGSARGDAKTQLSDGVPRPTHWPPSS